MDQNFELPDLAALRRTKGISLRAIADKTKISLCYLEAIEAGKFDKLPGGIYSRSYIRQYARAVEFDEFELLKAYYVRTGDRPEIEAIEPQPARVRRVFAELLRLASSLKSLA
jgi:cytoskeletal protein RodZ